MKSNCLYDSEQKFKPILCKSQTKILYFSSVQKKKKKPTDRPNPKTMGRVTANKLFIKDGLSTCTLEPPNNHNAVFNTTWPCHGSQIDYFAICS